MAKKAFDSTTKQLLELHPRDWLVFAGLPLGDAVQVVDADLSSFTLAADKVLRVDGPLPYIAHFEFQAGVDVNLDRRVLLYNVLLRWRFGLPVRTIVIMLRPEAMSPSVMGRVHDATWSDNRLEFEYKTVRVWEQPAAALLAGGVGTLPLAPISAVTDEQLDNVLLKMEQRLREEIPSEAPDLETAAYILMGLRYPRPIISRLLRGVRQMKESVTYQAILEEGEAKGERAALLQIGRKKLGPPSDDALRAIESIADVHDLTLLIDRVFDVSSWEQLLAK